jgi:hypothetical protein
MIQKKWTASCFGVGLLWMFGVGVVAAQTRPTAKELLPTTTHSPDEFGTQSYTVTRIPAVSFLPADGGQEYHTSGSLGRFGALNVNQHFYATLNVPQGAVIDYIGLNNLNDLTPLVMGVTLYDRYDNGVTVEDAAIGNSPHDTWQTDINASPIGFEFRYPNPLILDVEIYASANLQFFGEAEVWWRRSVSPAPGIASFNDVPTGHPYFQFVEALAASGITAGCGSGNYCPDNPVTRGQMAVFLSKALGLNWPN